MTIEQLGEELCEIRIPTFYHKFDEGEGIEPPFIAYFETGGSPFYADGKAYFIQSNVVIELYTDRKQPEYEKEIQSVLKQLEMGWDKSETYIPDEQLYKVSYECEVQE